MVMSSISCSSLEVVVVVLSADACCMDYKQSSVLYQLVVSSVLYQLVYKPYYYLCPKE
jgi:hypothetical protein